MIGLCLLMFLHSKCRFNRCVCGCMCVCVGGGIYVCLRVTELSSWLPSAAWITGRLYQNPLLMNRIPYPKLSIHSVNQWLMFCRPTLNTHLIPTSNTQSWESSIKPHTMHPLAFINIHGLWCHGNLGDIPWQTWSSTRKWQAGGSVHR